MLAIDGQKKLEHAAKAAVEEYQQKCQEYVARELQHACYVSDSRISVANAERQLGRPMNTKTLKDFIEKTNPKLRVEHHPWKGDKICIYHLKNADPWEFDPVTKQFGGEQKVFIGAGEGGLAPEWSIMSVKETEVPYNDQKAEKRGVRKEKIPWREEKRGWRAVLRLLVGAGHLNVEKVERFVAKHGSLDTRLSWASAMGKTTEQGVF